MTFPVSLPSPNSVQYENCIESGDEITLFLRTSRLTVPCPCCGQSSHRVHSHYERKLADLPVGRKSVRIRLKSRRFFCDNSACERRIFTEPLTGLANPYAHQTLDLREALRFIGLAVGGRPGERLAKLLGLIGSRYSILQSVKSQARKKQVERAPVRVLGIDDWSFRRGHRYGTILCDLERHVVIDILPDRNAQSAAEWMKQHPEIEFVSRDRGGTYADAAREGAPQAIQVADRFHLVKNMLEMINRLATLRQAELRDLLEDQQVEVSAPPLEDIDSAQNPSGQADVVAEVNLDGPKSELPAEQTNQENLWDARRVELEERYRIMVELRGRGTSLSEIARLLGMDRATVSKYLKAGSPPQPRYQGHYSKLLEVYRRYLDEQWAKGRKNSEELFRELKTQGFKGSSSTVRHYLRTQWGHRGHGRPRSRGRPRAPDIPPPRQIAWLLLYPDSTLKRIEEREGAELREKYQTILKRISESDSQLKTCAELGREFIDMVAHRKSQSLADWINRSRMTASAEFANFANRLSRDYDAVLAALQYEISNGQVEGQVNRLKTLKRQMYGRASVDLLHARLIPSV